MALPATEGMRHRAMELARLLLPVPGRLEFAVRLALICALTALVTEIYQTPDPALTVYVAFFLIKPDRTASIIISVILLIVLTVTLLIVLGATIIVIDQPAWRVAAMTLLSFGLMFLASASKLRPIAPIVALITAYALDLLGTIQIGEIATRGLLYAWLFVGIPAGLSILVNLLMGPAPRRLAERALAHRLHLAAALLRDPQPAIRHDFQAVLQEGNGEILTRLKLAGVEKTSSPVDLAALRQAAASTLRIMLLADVAHLAPEATLPPEMRAPLADKLEAMAAILAAGRYPVEIDPLPGAPEAAAETEGWWAEMQDALTHFATPAPAGSPAPPPAKPAGGFFAADAFSNPVHVHHALKTTGAAMFCYILYSLLDWPTIHTCLITCYIVALSTAAEAVEKLTLRILGCLLGAAAGIAAIVFLVSHLTSIGGLMITVFLAALASAWVAGGDERIAYAGFQIAFAFFLCVLQGNGPSFDMVTARDRVIGILLGNVVVYLVFTTIWPVSVAARVDPALTALLRTWSSLLRSGKAAIPAVSQALAALGALARDVELVRYEPQGLRPPAAWLDRRRRAVAHLAALAGPLWLSAGGAPGFSHDTATRLDRIADAVGDVQAPIAPVADPGDAPDGLHRQIDTHLRGLEDLLESPPVHQTVLSHATA